MPRKRSFRELRNLEDAISTRIASGRGGALSVKAEGDAIRYAAKIARSKSARNATERYQAARAKNDTDAMSKIMSSAHNRKYSASTYKGLAAG